MRPRAVGHVARSIAEGKRPFLTCTVTAETFDLLDGLSIGLNLSRGRIVDRALALLAEQIDGDD